MQPTGETIIFMRHNVHDKTDNARSSYVDGCLKVEEREFLRLVQEGNIKGLKTILEIGNIDADCCDFRGQRALDIAIINQDFKLVAFLLESLKVTAVHYYCAILRTVFEHEAEILEMILEKAEEDTELHDVLKMLINGGSNCTQCLPEVAATNLTPPMAAAIIGDLEITRILLEKGYKIEKPHMPKCQCLQYCAKRDEDGETLTESIIRINSYKALSSPTYLILTSEDPILEAFKLSQEVLKMSMELPEHQKEYLELSRRCSKFAADILHQCRNTEEVQTVLAQKRGFDDPRPHVCSRLHLAVRWEQKEFVTHPSCQQVLRSMWVSSVGSWYSWSFRRRTIYVLKHAILTPFVSLAFIFIPRAEVIGPLRVPLNRFIYFASSYLLFLTFLMATLLNDRRYDVKSKPTWTEIAVVCFVLGHLWDILTNLISLGFSKYFRSWWLVFDLITFSLFLIAQILLFSIFIYSFSSAHDRMNWHWFHPILLGEGIYAAASVMAYSRLLLWFQVNARLGPLGTTVKYMLADVMRFFMLFFIIMLAFATGINSIYKNYRGSSITDGNEILEQPAAFITLKLTFKHLFWAIFGLGEPDSAQIVVGNSAGSNNVSNGSNPEHIFTESVGYMLWGLYHMVTVVVLLNMLIAMMTESYQRVQANSDMEWKFACSTLWLTLIDNHSVIPPPFNLIPSMHRITLIIQGLIACATGKFDDMPGKMAWTVKRCCYWDMTSDCESQKLQEEKYEKLMIQLIRRYLHNRELQSKCHAFPDWTSELKKEIKDEITQDLQKSLKMQNRSFGWRKATRRR